MDSTFPCFSLLDMKVIWLDIGIAYINSYKFMSGCLYFPNKLQDIKDHI